MRWLRWLMLWSLAATGPVLALDQGDFPIKIFIEPVVRKVDPKATPENLAPDFRLAIRQAILDWNQLAVTLPEEPSEKTLPLILRRDIEDTSREDLFKLNFLILTEDRAQADLIIESADVYLLNSLGLPGFGRTQAQFDARSEPTLNVGKITLGLKDYEQRLLNLKQFRQISRLSLGFALGFEITDNANCNVMSPNLNSCITDSPFECRSDSQLTFCVGIKDSQLRRLDALRKTTVGQDLPLQYQTFSDYRNRIYRIITRQLLSLPVITRAGDLKVKLTDQGEVADASVSDSFGGSEIDIALIDLIKKVKSFGPLPATNRRELTLTLKPNADLHEGAARLQKNFVAALKTKAVNTPGQAQLVVNGKGELVRYQITQSFGNKDADRIVRRVLEDLLPSVTFKSIKAKQLLEIPLRLP